MKRLVVHRERCTGCRACEIACVVHHEGRFGISAARLHVVKREAVGLDQPHVCRLCARPPCAAACPSGALRKDEDTGAVVLDSDRCIGCAACVEACPFGMATLHPESGLALICDLCSGSPACVKRCPTQAIAYVDPSTVAQQRRHMLGEKKG